MIVLGIDPGQRTLGYCVAQFIGQRREHHVSGSVKEVETDLVSWLSGMLDAHLVDVVGIEDHVWMGAEKSANPQQRCNAAIGITGKVPKARVKRAVEALFPSVPFKNEHERDAVAVCMAARLRAGRNG